MQRPQFQGTISLGQAVQIGVLLIGIGSGYALIQEQAKSNAELLKQATTERGQLEVRVRSVENELARVDERYSSIMTYLSRIDGRLERIEQAQ